MASERKQIQKGVTPQQVKLIHTLKSALGMDDDQYRFALYEGYRAESSKELTFIQAEGLLRHLKEKAAAQGVWKERPGPGKKSGHQGLKGRAGYATPSQLDYIAGLWNEVSRVPEEQQAKALRGFLLRVAKVSDLRFLPRRQVSGVITALKQMRDRQQEGRA
jgi:hypothetical protein